jgi:hypothetical protein
MKCEVCGYDEAAPFVKIHVPNNAIIVKKDDIEPWETGGAYQTLYGCPKCGTLRLKHPLARKEHGKFSGCKCPWCDNTHPDEFAIHKEERMQGISGRHTNYRMTCSCGASGPDADSEEVAIEKYRRI